MRTRVRCALSPSAACAHDVTTAAASLGLHLRPQVKCMAVCQTRGGQHGTLHTRRRDARALFKENEFEYDDSMSEEQRAGFLWARGKHPPFVPPIAAGGADT